MNLPGVLILLLVIGIVFLFTEKMVKKGRQTALLARKLLHITGVGGLAISPVFFFNHALLSVIAGFFGVLLYFAVKRRLLAADLYHRESLGIALFPFSFLVLWLLWGQKAPQLVIYPMLVLAFSDAAAAIFGGVFGQKKYIVSGDEKSFLGSFSFFCSTLWVLWLLPSLLESIHPVFHLELHGTAAVTHPLLIYIIVSVLAAAIEGATSGGWDNVSVPFVVAWLLAVLPGFGEYYLYGALPVLVLLAVAGWLAWQKKWLNGGGSVVATIMGFVIWVGGHWQALLLVGLFFVSGSLLGKLNKGTGKDLATKIGNPRDYRQVLCNGGVSGACLVWYSLSLNPLAFTLFAVSVAISMADTWSSEIGIWARGRVVDIIGFKPLPVGMSGGISLWGTMAGLAGSSVIGLLAWAINIGFPLWIAVFGFSGMLADSVAGSLFQARFRVGYGQADARPEAEEFTLEKGWLWMDNDLVNLLSNLFMTILAGFLLYFCA